MTTQPAPGVLREAAVAALVGALHNAHQSGPWALVELTTKHMHNGTAQLTFACGYPGPDGADERVHLVITVAEHR